MAKIAVLVLCAWAVCCAAFGMQLSGPAYAGDIRVGVAALPADPGNPYVGSVPNAVRSALFDALTRFDKSGNLVPALATSWKNESPTIWRFVLRRDVVFSNGEPLTATAVAATITWLQTPEGQLTPTGHALPDISAEVEDDNVVILHTAKPDPILPRRLSDVMIVAPRAWAELGPAAYAKTPATSGPFKAGDWGAPDKIMLMANSESWRKPKADRLILTAIADSAARTKALTAGQIDVAANIGVDDMNALDGANLLTSVTPAMAVMAVAFRQEAGRDSPLLDPRVRRALNYAVDRNDLIQSVLHGLGRTSGQPAARDVFGFDADVKAYPFDPEKAKALLAEAGYGAGLKLRIAVAVDRYAGDKNLIQGVVTALANVGVTLDVVTLTDEAWASLVRMDNWGSDIDGFSMPFDAAPTDDVVTALAPYSCLKAVPFVCDRAITTSIIAAQEAMSADRRATLLADLAQTFHDDPPALYLVDAFDVFGVSRKVEGFAVANRVPIYETLAPVGKAAAH